MPKLKMTYCFNCGEELGLQSYSDPLDTCGKAECNREASAAIAAEREEAHEQLDRDMGW